MHQVDSGWEKVDDLCCTAEVSSSLVRVLELTGHHCVFKIA
jgi:hypothetical protein